MIKTLEVVMHGADAMSRASGSIVRFNVNREYSDALNMVVGSRTTKSARIVEQRRMFAKHMDSSYTVLNITTIGIGVPSRVVLKEIINDYPDCEINSVVRDTINSATINDSINMIKHFYSNNNMNIEFKVSKKTTTTIALINEGVEVSVSDLVNAVILENGISKKMYDITSDPAPSRLKAKCLIEDVIQMDKLKFVKSLDHKHALSIAYVSLGISLDDIDEYKEVYRELMGE